MTLNHPVPASLPSFLAPTEPPAVMLHKHPDGGFSFSHNIRIGTVWRACPDHAPSELVRVIAHDPSGILVCLNEHGERTHEWPVWLQPVYGPRLKCELVPA